MTTTDGTVFASPRARLTWLDGLVAIGAAVIQVGGTVLFVTITGSDRPLDPLAIGLLLASGLSLVGRDRWPLPVLFVVALTAMTYVFLGYAAGFYTIGLVFAIWAAVAAGYRLVGALVVVLLIVLLVVAAYVVGTGHAHDPEASIWFGGWLVAAFVLGEVSRGRRSYLEQVERRAFEAERTREEEA